MTLLFIVIAASVIATSPRLRWLFFPITVIILLVYWFFTRGSRL